MMESVFPYSVWDCWWLAPLAFLLDTIFGDPKFPWPHPVSLAGRMLHCLEAPARRWDTPAAGRAAGFICLFVLVAAVGFAVWLLLALPWLGVAAAVYFAWAGLALGNLVTTGRETLRQVETCSPDQARSAVSMLVSRDVNMMDIPLLRKTLADTLSENFTDAFLAPFFWLLVAGPVGLWCYKAVSTADSMWGYVAEPWMRLGFACARCDDLLAFVPARISIIVLWLTDRFFQAIRPGARLWKGIWPGFRAVVEQARGMPSPNSGWPMTVCAWLCGRRMAGPAVYFGILTHKPWLGPPESSAADWDKASLLALCALLRRGGLCGALLLWFVCAASAIV